MFQGAPVCDLIQRLLLLIDYEAHLKKSQQDWETRWENVQELINFASPLMVVPGEGAKNVDREPLAGAPEAAREVVDLVNDSEADLSNSTYVFMSSWTSRC